MFGMSEILKKTMNHEELTEEKNYAFKLQKKTIRVLYLN